MSDMPEELWVDHPDNLFAEDNTTAWFHESGDHRKEKTKYIRADLVEELRTKAEAFDRIVEARERATPVIVTAANETEPFTSRGREPEILSINNGETP